MFSKIIIGVLLVCLPIMQTFAVTQVDVLRQSQGQVDKLSDSLKKKTEALDIERAVLERHRISLDDARSQLEQTQVELEMAKRLASKSNSEADMRELRRIQSRFERHQAKVERYQERENESRYTITLLEKSIASLESELNEYRSEIERLNVSRQAAKGDGESKVVNVAVISSQRLSTESEPQSQSAEVSSASPLPAEPEDDKASWPGLTEVREKDIVFASARLKRLSKLKAAGRIDKSPMASVEIEARQSFGVADMEYIGDDLYSLVQRVGAGRQNFRLFNQEYWLTIPTKDDKALFRILFDVSSISQPKLIVFKEGLLR